MASLLVMGTGLERVTFGFLLFFGLDHFFNYIPFPEMAPEANEYFGNLLSTGAIQLVGVVEVLAGLAFIYINLED